MNLRSTLLITLGLLLGNTHLNLVCGLDTFSPSSCNISASLRNNIQSYNQTITRIVTEITEKIYKGMAFAELAKYTDKFGHRMTGSKALEDSIDYLRDEMQMIPGFRNVHTENVTVPKWLRGTEWATLIEPWEKPIDIMGCQYSVSTVPSVISAEVVVLSSEDELTKTPEKFSGKIVACAASCNLSKLSDLGALAILFGGPFGLYTVHPGKRITYEENHRKIPCATVTKEDMTLFKEIDRLGNKMVLKISMDEPRRTNTTSRNLIGDYFGSVTKPESYVGVAAHMDSWDVGEGTQDDGFAVIQGILTVKLFSQFGLQPRRTVRAMFWTSEELGSLGSKAYTEVHAKEMSKFQAVYEADTGCEVTGLAYHGNKDMGCIIYEIFKMIQPLIPSLTFGYRSSWGSDNNNFMKHGVPTLGNKGGPRYRWYTHANPDTMDHVRSKQLDRCFAVQAATVYVLADMTAALPREQP